MLNRSLFNSKVLNSATKFIAGATFVAAVSSATASVIPAGERLAKLDTQSIAEAVSSSEALRYGKAYGETLGQAYLISDSVRFAYGTIVTGVHGETTAFASIIRQAAGYPANCSGNLFDSSVNIVTATADPIQSVAELSPVTLMRYAGASTKTNTVAFTYANEDLITKWRATFVKERAEFLAEAKSYALMNTQLGRGVVEATATTESVSDQIVAARSHVGTANASAEMKSDPNRIVFHRFGSIGEANIHADITITHADGLVERSASSSSVVEVKLTDTARRLGKVKGVTLGLAADLDGTMTHIHKSRGISVNVADLTGEFDRARRVKGTVNALAESHADLYNATQKFNSLLTATATVTDTAQHFARIDVSGVISASAVLEGDLYSAKRTVSPAPIMAEGYFASTDWFNGREFTEGLTFEATAIMVGDAQHLRKVTIEGVVTAKAALSDSAQHFVRVDVAGEAVAEALAVAESRVFSGNAEPIEVSATLVGDGTRLVKLKSATVMGEATSSAEGVVLKVMVADVVELTATASKAGTRLTKLDGSSVVNAESYAEGIRYATAFTDTQVAAVNSASAFATRQATGNLTAAAELHSNVSVLTFINGETVSATATMEGQGLIWFAASGNILGEASSKITARAGAALQAPKTRQLVVNATPRTVEVKEENRTYEV